MPNNAEYSTVYYLLTNCPLLEDTPHLLTSPASSASLSCPRAVSLSLAYASLPLKIGPSNFFLNSLVVPSIPVFTKCSKLKYSRRSFWMGVPDSNILRGVCRLLSAVYVRFSQFFRRCPSSHITMPTLLLCRTGACRRNVSYEMIRMGVAARRPYCDMKAESLRSISSFDPESMERGWTRPPSHLTISLCQF